LLFDFLGALLWTSAFAGVGFIFGKQVDRASLYAQRFGGWILMLYVSGIISDELKHKLESGEQVVIVDLRHPLDVLSDPRTLPGALQISPEELENRHGEITRDGEIVLFCT